MRPAPLTMYRVRVYDPETGATVNYRFRDFNERAADKTARCGYTGLLGGPELQRIQDQLEVEVVKDLRQS